MKVYLLFEEKYSYDPPTLIGVFSTEAKAKEVSKKCRYLTYIEEHEVQ